jgi:hypothetical protein
MNKKDKINDLIDQALRSVDGIERAVAKPFLLTRINARLNKSKETVWEKASWFIGRPSVAFTGLTMLILINVTVIIFNRSEPRNIAIEQSSQENIDEFSYTAVSTIYDFENSEQQ